MTISRSSIKQQVTKPPSKKKKKKIPKLGTGERFENVVKAIKKSGKSEKKFSSYSCKYRKTEVR